MVSRWRAAAGVALMALLAGGVARADDDDAPTPWDRGRISLSIALASEDAFGESYFLVGAGVGYFVLSGLEVGVDGVHWFGGDPAITVVSPQVRYIAAPLGWPLLPYAGGFYTHYFIGDPVGDLDTIGGRLGLVYQQGRGVVVGVGAVVERIVSECSEECTSVYPEVSLGFSF